MGVRVLMLIAGLVLSPLLCSMGGAQETVYPSGSAVNATYDYTFKNYRVTDTLMVHRTIVNRTSYDLNALYLSENIPNGFHLAADTIWIGNAAIVDSLTGPAQDEVIAGYACYRWIIDFPDTGQAVRQPLHSGDTLQIKYKLICDHPGAYTMPFHSACFFGNGGGFFTLADSMTLTVTIPPCGYLPGDANADGDVNGLDVYFMAFYLMRGLAPAINCYCPPNRALFASCDTNGDCVFNGLDVVYLRRYFRGPGAAPRFCSNCPSSGR